VNFHRTTYQPQNKPMVFFQSSNALLGKKKFFELQ